MKKFNKSLVIIFALSIMMASLSTTVKAESVRVPGRYTGNAMINYYAIVSTTSVNAKVKPIYATQTYHKKGITTTIDVENSVTKSVETSGEITGEWGGPFITASVSLGVALSESMTVTASVSYSLKNQKSGRYRIETVFPGEKVTFAGYKEYYGRTYKEYSKNITYMPSKFESYKRLKRYSS